MSVKNMYIYRRGNPDDFEVTITVSNNDNISYHKILHPPSATKELIDTFLEEAEKAALRQIDKQIIGATDDTKFHE